MTTISPLFYLTLLPIAGALLIMFGAPARLTARLASVCGLAMLLFVVFRYDLVAGGYQLVSGFDVLPEIGLSLSFGADGLSLAMLFLATVVSVAAVWVIPPMKEREHLFYVCVLLISAGVIGAFSSMDLLFFYAFHEIALIPTFLLIGIWGSGDRQTAAWKATIYLGLGSFVLLLGIMGLYLSEPMGGRTFDIPSIQEMAKAGAIDAPDWVYLLLLFGFGTLDVSQSLPPFRHGSKKDFPIGAEHIDRRNHDTPHGDHGRHLIGIDWAATHRQLPGSKRSKENQQFAREIRKSRQAH